MRDHLGQEGVEGCRSLVADVAEAVGADAGSGGRFVGLERAGGGSNRAVRRERFHVDPRLDRITARAQPGRIVESEVGDRRSLRGSELGLDQVDAGDLLGDRVLDLQTRVGLEEVEAVIGAVRRVEQELKRAQGRVADVASYADGGLDDGLAGCGLEVRGRRDLDDLLEPALDGALALPEMSNAAVEVADDLDFNVSGAGNELLDVERAGTECHLRLGDAAFPCRFEFVDAGHGAGAAAAAAGDGLEHDRGVITE